jgi:hypothetical protein
LLRERCGREAQREECGDAHVAQSAVWADERQLMCGPKKKKCRVAEATLHF